MARQKRRSVEEKKLFGLTFKYDRDPRDTAAGVAAAVRVRRGCATWEVETGGPENRGGSEGAGAVFLC